MTHEYDLTEQSDLDMLDEVDGEYYNWEVCKVNGIKEEMTHEEMLEEAARREKENKENDFDDGSALEELYNKNK